MPYSMAVYPFPSFAFLAPPRVAFSGPGWSGSGGLGAGTKGEDEEG